MEFTGITDDMPSGWTLVGAAGFSGVGSDYISLTFDSNSTPYVAYRAVNGDRTANVWKFTGDSWTQVGSPVSDGVTANLSLAIYHSASGTDTPYLAYSDYGNGAGGGLTVRKFDGSTWITVGAAVFSTKPSSDFFMSLVIDSSGTPYVAYSDTANGYKATAMKFNGSAWATVGLAGFSAGKAYGTSYSLVIDSSGTPYVGYQDYSNSANGKATVMKFDGSSWTTVGTAGLTKTTASYPSLAINSSGTLYLAYGDGDTGKALVMKAVK